MRREHDTQRASELPRRFTGGGILAVAIGLALFAFLVVGPMVESASHLEALEDLDNRERLERGLRMLCNTRPNIDSLNANLATKTLSERNKITAVAEDLDCLESLQPRFRAEHYIWQGAPRGAIDQIVAQGDAAIEPSIEALEADIVSHPRVRSRAMRALSALSTRLLSDHRQRIAKRLGEEDVTSEAQALRLSLGLTPSRPETPTPIDVPPPSDLLPPSQEEIKEQLDEELSEPPAEENQEDEVIEEQEEAENDFELGKGSLRLRLPGMGAPSAPRETRRPTLDLDTPTPQKREPEERAPARSGLLYDASSEPEAKPNIEDETP